MAQAWLVPLEMVFSVSRFEPELNWNRFLAAQRRSLNSLNPTSGEVYRAIVKLASNASSACLETRPMLTASPAVTSRPVNSSSAAT